MSGPFDELLIYCYAQRMTSPSSPPEPSGDLRASDGERERVAEALRRHHVDGRIDTDARPQRPQRGYTARTGGELTVLLADLPGEAPPRRPYPPAGRTRRPLAAAVLLVLRTVGTVGAIAHGHHPGPFPFLAVLLLLKLAWGGPWRRRTAWGPRGCAHRPPRRATRERRCHDGTA